MRYIIVFFWLIIIALALTFTALNSHTVLINYYFGTSEFHLPVLLLCVAIIGIILGMLLMLPSVWRARGVARKCKKAAKNHAQELDNLRRMPIKEEH